MQASAAPAPAPNQTGPFGRPSGLSELLRMPVVEIWRVAGAAVVLVLSVTEAGVNEHVGGSDIVEGDALHVRRSDPAKPPDPVTVIVEEPD